jgi:hypothetical protein
VSLAACDAIARAVLYEGYVLYPYRPSSLKNRQRWTFGALAPRPGGATGAVAEAWSMQTQVLIEGPGACEVEVRVRFLHLVEQVGADWQVAVEREVVLAPRSVDSLVAGGHEERFEFAAMTSSEAGVTRRQLAVAGMVELHAERFAGDGVHRLTVIVHNLSDEPPGGAELASLASTHTVIEARGGALVSLMDPPDHLRAAAAACVNLGTWPVLVGPAGSRAAMLSAPIVLYDHPQVAPESPGEFFDGTEIDEMLVLRVLTLTDDEKAAAASCDERVRGLLERVEALTPERLMQLHGVLRQVSRQGGATIAAGARVRLCPRGRADAFDLALTGRIATVVSLERDQDGRTLLGVAIEDDPGRDLAELGLPGHRFFFGIDEVELLP